MVSSITVRRASVEDAQAIAVVHVQAWREAYAHLLPADALALLNIDRRAERWVAIIADGTDVWVAESNGHLVGWASASAGRDDDAPVGLELEGIYILASAYGSGAGQALLESAIGTEPAYLWMAADNPRAQRFYERNGFVLDGTTRVSDLIGTPVNTVRMSR
jgi:L-amino acid N-acyltransferase YncA